MINRPLPSLSVFDLGCQICHWVPTFLRLALVIGENRFACSFFLDGRRPPTRVPVEQASVRTALPKTESAYGLPVALDIEQIFCTVSYSIA